MDAERLRAPGSALRDRHASRLRPLLQRPELAVALVGAAVLVGWAFDVTVLKSVSPHYSSMKPNAALAFVLVGIGLTLVRPADGDGRIQLRTRFNTWRRGLKWWSFTTPPVPSRARI